jgi:hypothetical protein
MFMGCSSINERLERNPMGRGDPAQQATNIFDDESKPSEEERARTFISFLQINNCSLPNVQLAVHYCFPAERFKTQETSLTNQKTNQPTPFSRSHRH